MGRAHAGLGEGFGVAAAEAVEGDAQQAAPLTRVALGGVQDGLAQGAAEQEQVVVGDAGAQNAGVRAAGA